MFNNRFFRKSHEICLSAKGIVNVTEGDVIAVKIDYKTRFLCCVGQAKKNSVRFGSNLKFLDVASCSAQFGEEVLLMPQELMVNLDELWSCPAFQRVSYLSKSELQKLIKLSDSVKQAESQDRFYDESKPVFMYQFQGQRLSGEREAWQQSIESLRHK